MALQSQSKQKSFSPLTMNHKAQSPADGILSGDYNNTNDTFTPSNRIKYKELYNYKCQDPTYGQYYYNIIDLNTFQPYRNQNTIIKINNRSLCCAEQIKQYEPDTYNQNIISIDDNDNDNDNESPQYFIENKEENNNNFNNIKPSNENEMPIFQRQRTLWQEAILSNESQYTYDSTASCTIMALECAMQLQLEHKNFVHTITPDQQKITQILKIASMYKSDIHTDVEDVMDNVSRYNNNLCKERFHQILVPNWSELSTFIKDIGKEFKSEISCVVTKPPETVFMHFYFPLLGDKEGDLGIIQPLIFDSHARTERGLNGAHMLRFEDVESFENYLTLLWPKVFMGNNPSLRENEVNTVNIDVITLNPQLRDKPKLNLKKLQREFNALSAKVQPWKHKKDNENENYEFKSDDNYSNNIYGNNNEYNVMNNSNEYDNSNFEPGKNENMYMENVGNDGGMVGKQAEKIQQLQGFVREKSKINIRLEKDLKEAKERIVRLEKDKMELNNKYETMYEEYNALGQQLARGFNDSNSEINEKVQKLQKNRDYLIKQLTETKKKMEELRSNTDVEKRQWKQRETDVFNKEFEKMVKVKDQKIVQLEKQLAELLNELKPYREEARRIAEQNRTYRCLVCFGDFKVQGDCFLMDCGHMMNRQCAIATFKADMQNNKVLPRCPECLAQKQTTFVSQNLLELLFDQKLIDLYLKFSLETGLRMSKAKIFHCPTADCTFLAEIPDDLQRFNCNKCGLAYCTKCSRAYHHKETCEQYAARKCKEEQLNEKKLEQLAKKQGWNKCKECGTWMERTYGCFHMTCGNPQCKAEFCDSCGNTLDKKNWRAHYNQGKKGCKLWNSEADLINNNNDDKKTD